MTIKLNPAIFVSSFVLVTATGGLTRPIGEWEPETTSAKGALEKDKAKQADQEKGENGKPADPSKPDAGGCQRLPPPSETYPFTVDCGDAETPDRKQVRLGAIRWDLWDGSNWDYKKGIKDPSLLDEFFFLNPKARFNMSGHNLKSPNEGPFLPLPAGEDESLAAAMQSEIDSATGALDYWAFLYYWKENDPKEIRVNTVLEAYLANTTPTKVGLALILADKSWQYIEPPEGQSQFGSYVADVKAVVYHRTGADASSRKYLTFQGRPVIFNLISASESDGVARYLGKYQRDFISDSISGSGETCFDPKITDKDLYQVIAGQSSWTPKPTVEELRADRASVACGPAEGDGPALQEPYWVKMNLAGYPAQNEPASGFDAQTSYSWGRIPKEVLTPELYHGKFSEVSDALIGGFDDLITADPEIPVVAQAMTAGDHRARNAGSVWASNPKAGMVSWADNYSYDEGQPRQLVSYFNDLGKKQVCEQQAKSVPVPDFMISYAWNEFDEGGTGNLADSDYNRGAPMLALKHARQHPDGKLLSDWINDSNAEIGYSGAWSYFGPLPYRDFDDSGNRLRTFVKKCESSSVCPKLLDSEVAVEPPALDHHGFDKHRTDDIKATARFVVPDNRDATEKVFVHSKREPDAGTLKLSCGSGTVIPVDENGNEEPPTNASEATVDLRGDSDSPLRVIGCAMAGEQREITISPDAGAISFDKLEVVYE